MGAPAAAAPTPLSHTRLGAKHPVALHFEYHVTDSPAYNVPVLSHCLLHSSGTPIRVKQRLQFHRHSMYNVHVQTKATVAHNLDSTVA